jgi:hypothetical protein
MKSPSPDYNYIPYRTLLNSLALYFSRHTVTIIVQTTRQGIYTMERNNQTAALLARHCDPVFLLSES